MRPAVCFIPGGANGALSSIIRFDSMEKARRFSEKNRHYAWMYQDSFERLLEVKLDNIDDQELARMEQERLEAQKKCFHQIYFWDRCDKCELMLRALESGGQRGLSPVEHSLESKLTPPAAGIK